MSCEQNPLAEFEPLKVRQRAYLTREGRYQSHYSAPLSDFCSVPLCNNDQKASIVQVFEQVAAEEGGAIKLFGSYASYPSFGPPLDVKPHSPDHTAGLVGCDIDMRFLHEDKHYSGISFAHEISLRLKVKDYSQNQTYSNVVKFKIVDETGVTVKVDVTFALKGVERKKHNYAIMVSCPRIWTTMCGYVNKHDEVVEGLSELKITKAGAILDFSYYKQQLLHEAFLHFNTLDRFVFNWLRVVTKSCGSIDTTVLLVLMYGAFKQCKQLKNTSGIRRVGHLIAQVLNFAQIIVHDDSDRMQHVFWKIGNDPSDPDFGKYLTPLHILSDWQFEQIKTVLLPNLPALSGKLVEISGSNIMTAVARNKTSHQTETSYTVWRANEHCNTLSALVAPIIWKRYVPKTYENTLDVLKEDAVPDEVKKWFMYVHCAVRLEQERHATACLNNLLCAIKGDEAEKLDKNAVKDIEYYIEEEKLAEKCVV